MATQQLGTIQVTILPDGSYLITGLTLSASDVVTIDSTEQDAAPPATSTIAKVNGVALASFSKVNGVAKASFSKVNGISQT